MYRPSQQSKDQKQALSSYRDRGRAGRILIVCLEATCCIQRQPACSLCIWWAGPTVLGLSDLEVNNFWSTNNVPAARSRRDLKELQESVLPRRCDRQVQSTGQKRSQRCLHALDEVWPTHLLLLLLLHLMEQIQSRHPAVCPTATMISLSSHPTARALDSCTYLHCNHNATLSSQDSHALSFAT